ncbi:helix-turn-helix transcriptional regulator [Pseudoalteromonas sp. SSM20]|uniref:helix-turn-helix transcriptional regulator n=1 Tax=Pseudoalteromonas sp. SSM20 TaxID=3139394 RepID=UPI003BAD9B88
MKNEHLRLNQSANYIGVSLTTLWRLGETDPSFPPKIHITNRCCVYRKSDLDAWLASKEV